VTRFDAMTAPENAYRVSLEPAGGVLPSKLVWTTVEHGMTVRYESEPAKTALQKAQVDLLTVLPIDSEM
jgi:putative cardiolipin synthase